MKTTEKRRGRSLILWLASDPYRKLAAIALAIGLWFYLNNQIMRDIPRVLQLEMVGAQRIAGTIFNSRLAVALPTDQVVGLRFLNGENEIQNVTVRFKGPRISVDSLQEEAIDLQVTKFLAPDYDWKNRTRVDFTVSDIQKNLAVLQGVVLEMDPSRVTLEVEKIEDLPLTLSREQVNLIFDEQLKDRLRLDTTVFSQENAYLLGPASSLDYVRKKDLQPFRAQLRGNGNNRQLTAILELNVPASLGLRLRETPSLTIQVLPKTEIFELELPLRVDDLALPPEMRNQYKAKFSVYRVRIKAGGQLQLTLVKQREDSDKRALADWASKYLRLDVFIPPLEAGATYGDEIVREARLFLRGSLQPTVDRTECDLETPLSVTLRRTP
jgi:hypothetical protein